MRNYVIIYKISNPDSEKRFLNDLQKKFPRNGIHREILTYFYFAGRELPGIKDALKECMDRLDLDQKDYIVLYYTRSEEPDEINQLMIFGTAQLIKHDLLHRRITRTNLNLNLIEFLEYDFLKTHVSSMA